MRTYILILLDVTVSFTLEALSFKSLLFQCLFVFIQVFLARFNRIDFSLFLELAVSHFFSQLAEISRALSNFPLDCKNLITPLLVICLQILEFDVTVF